jgi:Tol biopolymer transport system component
LTGAERIRYAHQFLPAPDLLRVQPGLPGGLSGVVQKAMAKAPRERYASTGELLAAACAAAGTDPTAITDRVSPATAAPAAFTGAVPVNPPQSTGSPPAGVLPQQRAKPVYFFVAGAAIVAALALGLTLRPGKNSASAGKLPQQATMATVPWTAAIPPAATLARATPSARVIQPAATRTSAPTSPPPAAAGWIAYAFGSQSTFRDIFLMNTITQEVRQVTSNEWLDDGPVSSPDGRQLVFSSCPQNNCQLYSYRVSDGTSKQVTQLQVQAKFPTWCRAPGKNWIAFEARDSGSHSSIWSLDLDSGQATELTPMVSDARPRWSPDCSQILFRRENDSTKNPWDLFTYSIEDKNTQPVMVTPGEDEISFDWSPDGRWIAFTRVDGDTNGDGFVNWDDQAELFLTQPGGGAETNLTNGRFSVFSPAFSADSQQIIFTNYSSRSKTQEIWSLAVANNQFTQVTGADYYSQPVWVP